MRDLEEVLEGVAFIGCHALVLTIDFPLWNFATAITLTHLHRHKAAMERPSTTLYVFVEFIRDTRPACGGGKEYFCGKLIAIALVTLSSDYLFRLG